MTSFTTTISNFEHLPDEILLLICRYLSSPDILFSFYGLNSRLSQTISGFCQYVVLGQVRFKQFNYICKSILPDIGHNIDSLVVSNNWKGILSKVFLNYFGDKISQVFPHLKRLILTTFRIGTLISFLDCLQDVPELFELKINSLYDAKKDSNEIEILLHKIFTANNYRITSIMFDNHSLSFHYLNTNDIRYAHIEKLIIVVTYLNDLHRLLTVLSGLKYIDVSINQASSAFSRETELSPNLAVKHFRLRSFVHNSTLDDLFSIFQRIPYVEELIIQIGSNRDIRLTDGQQLHPYISSFSLKRFSYFLQFYYSTSIDEENILSSWESFNQEFVCIKSEDNNVLVLYTLPFDCPYVFLRYSVAKNKIFSNNYGRQIKCLALYGVPTRITDAFSCIIKCRQMETLILRLDEKIESKSVEQIKLRKLPRLTFFVALEKLTIHTDDFKQLFEISPNLHHLAVNYEFIEPMFDNESICYYLKHRITHLLVGITSIKYLELVTVSVSRFSTVFPSLKHLYFHIKIDNQFATSLILSMFNNLYQWKSLVSFGIANITMDPQILTKGLRGWVLENSFLYDDDSFLVDYSAETFRIWL